MRDRKAKEPAPEALAAMEAMTSPSQRDAWYFENHPDRRYRLRATAPGEFPPLGELTFEDVTIVAKAAPAVRLRFPLKVPVYRQIDSDARCELLLDEAGCDLDMIRSARAHFGGQKNG